MKSKLAGLLALVFLIGGSTFVKAETAQKERREMRHEQRENFRKKHPRRAQVNKRIQNQERRIHQQVKEGDISSQQAKADNQELNNIKTQERADVKANGGYLTKQQQGQLNQQLNGNSQNIGK